MLKKKIIPVFLASVLTVSGTTGFVTEAFFRKCLCGRRSAYRKAGRFCRSVR